MELIYESWVGMKAHAEEKLTDDASLWPFTQLTLKDWLGIFGAVMAAIVGTVVSVLVYVNANLATKDDIGGIEDHSRQMEERIDKRMARQFDLLYKQGAQNNEIANKALTRTSWIEGYLKQKDQ